jgi:hypothetical protein
MAEGYSAFSHTGSYGVGDYIYSPTRLYFGILESNGDFSVYRGSSPADPSKQKVWSTNSSAKYRQGSDLAITFFYTDYQMQHGIGSEKKMQIHGQPRGGAAYYLWQQPSRGTKDWQHALEAFVADDGNFGIRQNGATLWSSGFSDPVDHYEVENCDYDRARVEVRPQEGTGNVIEEVFTNSTQANQSMSLTRTVSTTKTSAWSDTLGIKLSISAKGGAQIPFLGKGELTVSTEISNTYTWSGSTSTSETISINLPVVVPPGRKYRAYAIIREANFQVPYTMTGSVYFKSGAVIHRTVNGVYTGKNSYLAEGGAEDLTEKKVVVAAFVRRGDLTLESAATPAE